MKYTYLAAALILGSALSASAQSKLNPAGSMMLNQWKEAHLNADVRPLSAGDAADPVVKVLITLQPGVDYNDILTPDMTFDCVLPSGNVLVDMPISAVTSLEQLNEVKALSFGDTGTVCLDKALPTADVDKVHSKGVANGLDANYTGKGVLCGIYDTGMDPNHITFTNGGSRVVAFFNGSTTYTQANMANAITDNANETHGTHCAGILAGNSAPRRSGMTDNIPNSGYKEGAQWRPMAMPYQGVANGADIYMVGGQGYDNSILSGVNRIINYAKEKNQPVVVSLSWGSNMGPHDGSRAICGELDAMAKDAIIVIAAGNEGYLPISCTKTLTAADNSLRTFVYGTGRNAISGMLQFWASNNQKLTPTISVYDKVSGKIVHSYTVSAANQTVNAANGLPSTYFASGSNIVVESKTNSANNRAYVSMNINTTLNSDNYVIALTIQGSAGQELLGISNKSVYFTSNGLAGYTNGTTEQTISDMACGKNTIVVGAYTTRTSYGVMPYNSTRGYSVEGTIGDIADFSSYGGIFGGRQLPDITAPGHTVISSISSFYTAANGYSPTGDNTASGYYRSENGRTYYFESMSGTSMATPFTAGVIALWLEAKPDLTTDDVRSIINATSTRDSYVEASPLRFGAGKINALKGLLHIKNGAVNEINADLSDRLFIEKNGAKEFKVTLAGANRLNVQLISISGAEVLSESAEGNEVNLNASSLASGIYILRAADDKGVATQKIVL